MSLEEIIGDEEIINEFETLESLRKEFVNVFKACLDNDPTNVYSQYDGVPGNLKYAQEIAELLLKIDNELNSKRAKLHKIWMVEMNYG